jgi:acetyltransferase-like isoleucine patch superfamily enzyme
VGPFVEIQKGVVIGARTRVQSHAFICELVTIGEDCFIGHGVMFVNDLFATGGPARGRKELWRSTSIGNQVSIGSNATILPVRICDRVVIGAGAVVTRDISESGVYAGNPARRLRAIADPST